MYYVENPFTLKDLYKLKGSKEVKLRKHLFKTGSDGVLATDLENLKVVVCPPLLSINFIPESFAYRALLKLNESRILRRINKVLESTSIQNYIFINSFNFHYPGVGAKLKPKLRVYHCVDPLILPFDRAHGIKSEEIIVKASDVVICTSRQLYNEKKIQNKRTYFIPNAADLSHSSKALDEHLDIHENLRNIKKPIVGYFGNIERRIDFELLRFITEQHPDKSFVFAGPVGSEFIPDWFYETPNIFLTGRVEYSQLPAMLKGFDLAIIPFKKDEVSSTIFPLKLFEYLGAGKPVIVTDFNPDLEEFTSDMVRFCKSNQQFSDAIDEELQTNSEEKIERRLLIAQENTWERRADDFSKTVFNAIYTKQK